jgi:hypothetical protein
MRVYVQSRLVASPRAVEVTLQWQHEWQAAQGSVAFFVSQTGLAPLVRCVGLQMKDAISNHLTSRDAATATVTIK